MLLKICLNFNVFIFYLPQHEQQFQQSKNNVAKMAVKMLRALATEK